MTSSRHTNYLRSSRKRLALSQGEVAFLMGKHGGAKISRYERLMREPGLRTMLAFELIYQKPAREIFSGIYKQIQRDIGKRAKILSYRKDLKPSGTSARKREAIAALALINQ